MVHDIGKLAYIPCADEEACCHSAEKNAQFCCCHTEHKLTDGIAETGKTEDFTSAYLVGNLAPEWGEQEICQRHSGESHAEHIVV